MRLSSTVGAMDAVSMSLICYKMAYLMAIEIQEQYTVV
jgi:hypothetical protein